MIDYVKLEINSKSVAEAIRLNPELVFKTEVINATGEETKQISKYRGLKFLIYPNNKIIIEGSIHKYKNEGEHNFDDFNFYHLSETIKIICEKFRFDPKEAILRGFEFGVNIITIKNPTDILKMILCYGNDEFNKMDIGKGIQSKQDSEIVKIYNKSIQYKRKENILRIENKIIRMRKIHNLEIKHLHDLIKPNKLIQLGKVLTEMFEKVIIHEPVKIELLTKPELKLYDNCGNPRFWTGLNRSQRHKKLSQYNYLIENKSLLNLKKMLSKQVAEKWYELLKKGDENTGIKHRQKGDENTRSILGNCSQKVNESNELKERHCLTCGRDISKQKKGSRFCSEKLFGKEVKLCRNNMSNPKNNLKKRVENSIKKYLQSSIPLFTADKVYKHLI
jgi:hypothetical protein